MNDKNVMVDENVEVEIQKTEEEQAKETAKEKKEKKHHKALRLVREAKQKVKDAEEQTQACKMLLAGDLQAYDDAKRSLHHGGYDICATLLTDMGYSKQEESAGVSDDFDVIEPKEELAPIVLKNVNSGRFTGMVYALFGGIVTAGGLTYLATEKLGMTLDISKLPSSQTVEQIASWFSSAVGLEPNVNVGTAIFSVSVLGVMAAIYLTRVVLKGSKNLHFAVKQLVEAELYAEAKGDCKAEMDRVDAHMKEAIVALKTYEVLLNEQKGKLERILHIEGKKSKSTDYHDKSFAEIRETKELLRSIRDVIDVPMVKEGKLSEQSMTRLTRAKTALDKVLERLY